MILLRIINIFLLASLCSISFGSKCVDINSRPSPLPDPIICKEGTSCVNFRFCKSAVKLLLLGNYEQRQSALKDRCETKKGELMVCCPSKSNNEIILPRDCGQSYNVSTVNASNDVQIGEFPWLVGIYSYQPKVLARPTCFGSLITAQYVLTAAHCFLQAGGSQKLGDYSIVKKTKGKILEITWQRVELDNSVRSSQAYLAYNAKLFIRLREHNLETLTACYSDPMGPLCPEDPIEIIPSKVIRHPLYDFTSHVNDIALIQLPEPLEISKDKKFDSIGPVCLPLEGFTMPEMMSSLVAVGIITQLHSVTRLKFEAILVNNSECDDLGLKIQPGQFCFKYLNVNKDQGHITGIIMTQDEHGRFVQVGFSSIGLNVGPEVATSISFYVDWIRSIIKI